MNSIKLWTENIIVIVVISIIIEMILPESTNKKYVKVVSGLCILYVIINPIINLNKNFEFNISMKNLIGEENVLTSSNNNDIANSYILSLQSSLKEKIEKLGYSVYEVQIKVSSDYENIECISIKMKSIRI